MPKRKARRQNSSNAGRRNPRAKIVIASAIVVSLFAAWTMLAYSGALDPVFRQKGDKKGASPYSDVDLATTTDLAVDPPVTQANIIYATHLLRLRTAVNAVQRTAGLVQFDWGDSSSLGVTVAPATGGTILKD